MKSLTIRGVDERLYGDLQNLAKVNHRSLQEQVKIILEREVNLLKGGRIHRAREIRAKLIGRVWGNIVEDIRKERER